MLIKLPDHFVQFLLELICFSGNSPHPSTPDEDDNQTELLIAEEKLSPEEEGQVMPRYSTDVFIWYYRYKAILQSSNFERFCDSLTHLDTMSWQIV